MKVKAKLLVASTLILTTAFLPLSRSNAPSGMPYRRAGLTEKQAAAHLLSRLTYGARPGDIDRVVKTGLNKWFKDQLEGKLPDDTLTAMLSPYSALQLSNAEIALQYPKNAQIVRMAVRDGIISKDSIASIGKKEYRDEVAAYMKEKGYQPQKELFRQLINQKILRAAYSQNQLHEVLTDFWFNHFNVSLTKNQCAQFIPAYERDVIRPNATGKFGDLLLATAQSPAMLYYLDNFSSASPLTDKPGKKNAMPKLRQARKNRGLNENYAREVMELHTLGVDGGYTQQDVTQAARVLTGWTVFPMGNYGNEMEQKIERPDKPQARGYVHQGDFLFTPNRHDSGEKEVLGKKFKAGGGYEEGVALLEMLAEHPATAQFICKKLATRFVSDTPPQSIVDKMAKTFRTRHGDIAAVLTTMVNAPEFWEKDAVREKTKSPFELVISTVRSLGAEIRAPYQLYTWVNRMGQNIYHYQAPTGFPDHARYWINTGALLNRMNFGLAAASGRIPGLQVDLARLNQHREPESSGEALHTYAGLMMPERDLSQTYTRLTPLLNDPELDRKVNKAATQMDTTGGKRSGASELKANNMLAQVVGILIGSPEFQRR